MIWSLYINNKNNTEQKVDYEFKSLMEFDYTTSKIASKEFLLLNTGNDIEKTNIYIKDSKNKTYAVIYNNDFLSRYIQEINSPQNFTPETLDELHRFLDKIKNFSISEKSGYLLEPYKRKDLNKYEMKSLALPKPLINIINSYKKRREELIMHPYSPELRREFDHDKIDSKFNSKIINNYFYLRSLIVWINNYKKIVDNKRKRQEKQEEKIETLELKENHQITFQEHLEQKKLNKESDKKNISNQPRILKNGQVVFDGIFVDPRDLDNSSEVKKKIK